jgi:hypothetical protein
VEVDDGLRELAWSIQPSYVGVLSFAAYVCVLLSLFNMCLAITPDLGVAALFDAQCSKCYTKLSFICLHLLASLTCISI